MRDMAFEPFGYGNRWYDRVGGRKLKLKEFAAGCLIVVAVLMLWHFAG
jgi:hypothetical protein